MTVEQKSKCVLIPAAGFGLRAGMPEAKELLPHPETGRPLIEAGLKLAASLGARAHVITREEKSGLIDFLRLRRAAQELTVQIVDPTREWPDTLLKSKEYWGDHNVVCLPDTEFAPTEILPMMFSSLHSSDLVFATVGDAAGAMPNDASGATAFNASGASVFSAAGATAVEAVGTTTFDADLATFGAIDRRMIDGQLRFFHVEKPISWLETARAWGLFGFRRETGELLLQQMLESTFDHIWRELPGSVTTLPLSSFRDLTRDGGMLSRTRSILNRAETIFGKSESAAKQNPEVKL